MTAAARLALVAGAASIGASVARAENPWLNADDARALVAEMMSDAEARSSLLASGATSGHDGRFFLASSDGDFRLNAGGFMQFRYYLNLRDDGDTDTTGGDQEDEFESGFQTRRTKLELGGHIRSQRLTYRVNANFSRASGLCRLEDAWAAYRFESGIVATWGQFKLPFLREELVSGKYQLAVDRSFADRTFNQDWCQGVQLSREAEDWRFAAAFSDGFGSRNSEFGSIANFSTFGANNVGGSSGRAEADWALTGRAEFKFAGAWDNFKDFTSPAGQPFACMLGVAGHAEQSANTPAVDFQTTYYALTADLSLEGDGWNAFISGNGSWANNQGSSPTDDADFADFGLVAQAGFLIPDTKWEPFARFDAVCFDRDRSLSPADDTQSFLTFGVNNYIHGHAAKFTADCVWAINSVGANPLNGTAPGGGLLADDNGNQVVIRLQFQLIF